MHALWQQQLRGEAFCSTAAAAAAVSSMHAALSAATAAFIADNPRTAFNTLLCFLVDFARSSAMSGDGMETPPAALPPIDDIDAACRDDLSTTPAVTFR